MEETNEIKVDVALDIIQLKIVHFIKNYKGNDKNEFQEKLKQLTEEKQKIYELDKETIDKVYDVYLEEIKRGE